MGPLLIKDALAILHIVNCGHALGSGGRGDSSTETSILLSEIYAFYEFNKQDLLFGFAVFVVFLLVLGFSVLTDEAVLPIS